VAYREPAVQSDIQIDLIIENIQIHFAFFV